MVISVNQMENTDPICRCTTRCSFDHDKVTHDASTKRTVRKTEAALTPHILGGGGILVGGIKAALPIITDILRPEFAYIEIPEHKHDRTGYGRYGQRSQE